MENIHDWFKRFFAVSDEPTAHEKYPTFFTEDAKLIMGDKTAVGHDGKLLPHREGIWLISFHEATWIIPSLLP